MSTRKRKQDEEDEEELQALPSDDSEEEDEYVRHSKLPFLFYGFILRFNCRRLSGREARVFYCGPRAL